jgi:hypothetical protein
LTTGFFDGLLWRDLGYEPSSVEKDYESVFEYVRTKFGIGDPAGGERWKRLDLEDIFTSVEIQREFANPESKESARLLLIRNKLMRYVQRILGLCTSDGYGVYSRHLVSALALEDSVVSFNYDLLVDQEFCQPRPPNPSPKDHYETFEQIVLRGETLGLSGPSGAEGVYVKLHGSLNWSQCTNPTCPRSGVLEIDRDFQNNLNVRMGRGEARCAVCDGELVPLLIPPLLHKPIAENAIVKTAWALAKRRLAAASAVVVIGYSAPPTDFYSRWLLRSTVGTRTTGDVKVLVVNPENGGNSQFQTRMDSIFPCGYDRTFTHFCQIRQILDQLGRSI